MLVSSNKSFWLLPFLAKRLFVPFTIILLFISCQSNKLNRKLTLEIPYSLQTDSMKFIIDSVDQKNKQGEFVSSEYKTNITLEVKGWVNDYDNLFTLKEIAQLDKKIADFEKSTTIEIAIVAFPAQWVNPLKFDEFVTYIGNQWGVGKKETNNGLVIGICKEFKKMRISTGLGIEKILPDADVKNIIDQHFIPSFKTEDYYTGCINGLDALFQRLR